MDYRSKVTPLDSAITEISREFFNSKFTAYSVLFINIRTPGTFLRRLDENFEFGSRKQFIKYMEEKDILTRRQNLITLFAALNS